MVLRDVLGWGLSRGILSRCLKTEPAKNPVSVRMCSQHSSNALARGSPEAISYLYRSSDLAKSSPVPTASTRCSAKPGRIRLSGIKRVQAECASPPVQGKFQPLRALYFSLSRNRRNRLLLPSPSVIDSASASAAPGPSSAVPPAAFAIASGPASPICKSPELSVRGDTMAQTSRPLSGTRGLAPLPRCSGANLGGPFGYQG